MDCVNHPGVTATAYCQNCGKAMCPNCVRTTPSGQVLCEPCSVSWQTMQQPFVAPPIGAPNPVAAAVLGLIPGVGAMYNGQFFKGLIHVVIFAVLVSISSHYGVFGIFIAAWIFYQSFEAYHTAVARRDGLPLPDPLGLNEVGNWLNLGGRPPYTGQQQPPPGTPASGTTGPAPTASQAPYAAGYQAQAPFAAGFQAQPPFSGGYQAQSPYSDPSVPPAPPIPPVPPVPPLHWRRREPIGALILIGFGLLLLLHQMGFLAERFVHFLWPLIFIAIGVWLILRRFGDSKGGTQ